MRRFNGWGDESVNHAVHPIAQAFLRERIGAPTAPSDATFEQVAAGISPSLLGAVDGIDTSAPTRVWNGVGQSFSDWLAIRTGRVSRIIDGVATPTDSDGVRDVMAKARNAGALVLPRGGGTSVAGHFVIDDVERPVVALSMEKMVELTNLDEAGNLATFGAGIVGPDVEKKLNARGFTLGHYPQSFEYSTLGGWVATRSAGHFSMGYGRIEGLFAGGEMITPRGTMNFAPVPATGAGPDLRQLALGSEGRMGVITSCTVKVRRLPEKQVFSGCFLPSAAAAMACVRELVQSGPALLMVRMSLPEETRTGLALSGHSGMTANLLHKYLALKGVKEDACLILLGANGSTRSVRSSLGEAHGIVRKHGGVVIGPPAGNKWLHKRFDLPYLRNSLWEMGYGIDTFETALPWGQVEPYIGAVESAVRREFEVDGEKTHVFTHLSHVYPHGSSVYTSYIFRLPSDADAMLARWRRAKVAASETIVRFGGTISHQHGVGRDHRPYVPAEKGAIGMSVLGAVIREVDPDGLFNTGNLMVDNKGGARP